jgi:hypothetical protein
MKLDAVSEVAALFDSQPGMSELREVSAEAFREAVSSAYKTVANYADGRKIESFARIVNMELQENVLVLIHQEKLQERFGIKIEREMRASNHCYIKVILERFCATYHKSPGRRKLPSFAKYRIDLSKNNPPLPVQLDFLSPEFNPWENNQRWAKFINGNTPIFVPFSYGLDFHFRMVYLEHHLPCFQYKKSIFSRDIPLYNPFETEYIDHPVSRLKDQDTQTQHISPPKPSRKQQRQAEDA